MTDWLVLTATLPTSPSGLRVRIWRALKATGCATLREGVYILPSAAPSAQGFWAIDTAIREGGADAHMLSLQARDATQEADFRALFDRSEPYADFALSLKEARSLVAAANEPDIRRRLRDLSLQLQQLQATDFFPGQASAHALSALEGLRLRIERKWSPNEPSAGSGAMEHLSIASFQGKTWATRKRPWVDRLATAWLVQRFVDAKPRFIWLADPKRCPKSAIGYDFDGARFSHVDNHVTFEVVAQSFGLDNDPALKRLGELVHFIDIGGIPVDEAAGIETMVRGLQHQHPGDDDLLAAACTFFDTLYAALRPTP
ncbi:MAG: hypothetical protein RLZZ618_2618 [Pseudomonadota bacterium]|jgi:hypothetical protein